MLKLIVLLIALIIVAIVILASFKPGSFRIERSATIQAPPDKVFVYVNELRSWSAWSVWEKMDPNMKKTYGATTAGKGATYEWQGNKKVGHGRMTITDSMAPSRIVIKLDFFAPMKAHNTAEFKLAPQGSGTVATWAMYGPMPFISKVFSIFFSMDKMVGKDFEDSLARLKGLAEQ